MFKFKSAATVAPVSKVASMQAQSSRILGTFTRTKNELMNLNQTLADNVAANEASVVALELAHAIAVATLKEENVNMSLMASQHANIISNIDRFLA